MFSKKARAKIRKMGLDPDEEWRKLAEQGYGAAQGRKANICEFCGGACRRRYHGRWFCEEHHAKGVRLVNKDLKSIRNPTLGFLSRNP